MKKIFNFSLYFPFLIFFIACSPKSTAPKKTIETIVATIDSNKADTKKSSDSDYYTKNYFRYEDFTYKKNIKTVFLHKDGFELAMPVLELNSESKLKLTFDDLDGDIKTYKYTVIHCDAYWKPTDALKAEYINGFENDFIENYKYSFNTLQRFTHFELIFPSENLQLTKSGNYLLKVFIDDNEDNVVLTRRFMISEPKLNVNATVRGATNLDDRNYKQEIDFTINTANYNISDPYESLKIVITQNGRWDNAIKGLKPKMVNGDILDYNYDDKNVFSGGNEFRKFDFRSLRYVIDPVYKINYDSSHYHVHLKNDQRRTFDVYVTNQDINGNRLIKTYDGLNDAIESDYANVYFFLPYKAPIVHGNLYVIGALTDWQFSEDNKLKYNYAKQGYELSLYLKQGYYNYQYVLLENGKDVGDESFIEGSHFETENDYIIFVYYREPGSYFDKIIGIEKLNSIHGRK